MGEGRFEPWMSPLETSESANQLSFKALGSSSQPKINAYTNSK